MNIIKNIHRLACIVPTESIEKLEAGAALHQRYSNITFKIISVSDAELIVKTEQGRSLSENYADIKTLIDRTRELFGRYFPPDNIRVQPVPYRLSPVDSVTPEWISSQMLLKSVKIKDIVSDTGLNKTALSAVINGNKPLSQINKAFFYYYLESK